MSSTCKSCGVEIRWIKMLSGRNMPVDYEPFFYKAVPGAEAKVRFYRHDEPDDVLNQKGYITWKSQKPELSSLRFSVLMAGR